MSLSKVFHEKWQGVTRVATEVDLTFLILRILSLLGGLVLLSWASLPSTEELFLIRALIAFSTYSMIAYLVIFLWPGLLREVYLASLCLDLIFLSYLVHSQTYMENSLFIGFYLLVCLHTVYFGLRFGLLVATLSASLYFLCIFDRIELHKWSDIVLHISFLYFIAAPVGLLANKVRQDKITVENLNNELQQSLHNLQTTQTKLIEAEKFSALGRLTAYIAHEIRNPLTALGGFARRLEKKLPEATPEKEYASIIIKEVSRLEKILLDTLIYGKTAESSLMRCEIEKPAQNATALFRDLCREQDIILTEQFAPGMPRGKIDSDQVQQAVVSLMTNSIHAMPSGGYLTVRTDRKVKNSTPYLTLSISDTGKGIDPEAIDYIFEPFYSTKKIGMGTGLGLPIVKKIMDEHHGLIKVDNQLDKGTAVTLFFPYQNEAQDQMTPCWEYLKCGIETDAARRCGAYPYFGRLCWSTAGSFSEGERQGICAHKIEDCRECSFYKIVNAHFPIYIGDGPSTPQ